MSATDLREVMKVAEQQQAHQQQLAQILNQALASPHVVTTLHATLIGVRFEEQAPGQLEAVLMIATLDGKRIDIPMSRPASVSVMRGLAAWPEEPAAAAEEPVEEQAA